MLAGYMDAGIVSPKDDPRQDFTQLIENRDNCYYRFHHLPVPFPEKSTIRRKRWCSSQ
ncbi:MAG: hypothetical protein HOE30_27575 [Deltaproteobacteria bacterium]|jgi:hypothetical protein|nr:hypothetical protein [Deltaproteobacteria bacterium]MBT4264761.1 hypothetical protein [Deltaproteobacteria bacterium]MBT4640469.1 hypothetical protein [Deltaproteobacteria bacterium]MBT6502927.1 hypothetical protein [Deltaproteobacteria bacterium]